VFFSLGLSLVVYRGYIVARKHLIKGYAQLFCKYFERYKKAPQKRGGGIFVYSS
jgi:hypothetical protein